MILAGLAEKGLNFIKYLGVKGVNIARMVATVVDSRSRFIAV